MLRTQAQDPLAQLQKLTDAQIEFVAYLRRALVVRSQVVQIGEHSFRFLHQGELFDDGDEVFQALECGIFGRHPATRGGEPAGYCWLHMGSSDDLECLLAPYVEDLDAAQMDAIKITLGASHVLSEDVRSARRSHERRG